MSSPPVPVSFSHGSPRTSLQEEDEVLMHSFLLKREASPSGWVRKYCILVKGAKGSRARGSLVHLAEDLVPLPETGSSAGAGRADARTKLAPLAMIDLVKSGGTPIGGEELALVGLEVHDSFDTAKSYSFMLGAPGGVSYPFAADSEILRQKWLEALHWVQNAQVKVGRSASSAVLPRLGSRETAAKSVAVSLTTAAVMASQYEQERRRISMLDRVKQIRDSVRPDGTVDIARFVELLHNRRFLRDRRDLLSIMQELLKRTQDPHFPERDLGLPPLIATGRVSTETEPPEKHSAILEPLHRMVYRLVELLILEPVESKNTSRIVAGSLLLLNHFTKRPDVHSLLTNYPLVSVLSLNMERLLGSCEHPGVLHHAARFLCRLFHCLVDVTYLLPAALGPSRMSVMSRESAGVGRFTASSIVDEVIEENDTDDEGEEVQDGRLLATSINEYSPVVSFERNTVSPVTFLGLHDAGNPLWPVMFSFLHLRHDGARELIFTLLADLSADAELSDLMCSSTTGSSNRHTRHSAITEDGTREGPIDASILQSVTLQELESEPEEPATPSASQLSRRATRMDVARASGEAVLTGGGVEAKAADEEAGDGSGRVIKMMSAPAMPLTQAGSKGSRAISRRGGGGGSGLEEPGGRHPPGSSSPSPDTTPPTSFSSHKATLAPVNMVTQIVQILAAERSAELRRLGLSVLANLLTHAQTSLSILRAVCIPEVFFAREILETMQARALRLLSESSGPAAGAQSGGRIMLNGAADLAFGEDDTPRRLSGEVTLQGLQHARALLPEEDKPETKLTLKQVATQQDIAASASTCLWYISCLLTQHSELGKDSGVHPSMSFDSFSGGKLVHEM